ncbi:MAG: glycosyltransferase family 1 protein [Candidatus Cloacimonetes bacterium]|nr:glycosyltransferase family 1 protein [Candidatus Cloacimonadota bacterium]
MYRILKISVPYRSAVEALYNKDQSLSEKPYAEQVKAIRNSSILMLDFVGHMQNLGTEAEEIYFQIEPLKQAWARENSLHPDTDEYEILKRQVQNFKPDILYVDDSYILGDRVEDLLKSVPGLKISLGRCGSAMTDRAKSQIRYYSHVIGVSLHFVNILQEMGLKSFEVKQGFEDTLLPLLRPETFPESCDVLFCGSFYAMEGGHHLRMSIFWDLVDLPCDFVIRTGTLKPRPIPLEGPSYKDKFIQRVGHLVKPEVSGLRMLEAYMNAKLGLNSHLDANGPLANNMRLYEVTGVGTCLVTDKKVNLPELFEEDREVVTYSSADEAKEKIRWLLDNPFERKKIAEAGQKRTLSEHTTRHRFLGFHQKLLELLHQ